MMTHPINPIKQSQSGSRPGFSLLSLVPYNSNSTGGQYAAILSVPVVGINDACCTCCTCGDAPEAGVVMVMDGDMLKGVHRIPIWRARACEKASRGVCPEGAARLRPLSSQVSLSTYLPTRLPDYVPAAAVAYQLSPTWISTPS